MLNTLFPFFLVCLCAVFQFGALILAQNKPSVWQWGIYAGMFGSGASALGFAAPMLNPYPCTTFIFAMTLMLFSVVVSYYRQTMPTDNLSQLQVDALALRRHSGVKYTGIGIALAVALSVLVGFTKGQKDSSDVQQSFAGVVYQLADEVRSLHQAVNRISGRMDVLEENDRKSAHGDSVARGIVIKNQSVIMKEIKTKRRN